MSHQVTAKETFEVGKEVFVEGPSPSTDYSTVFEDDGDTGYFYACDALRSSKIVDAMHIYNVSNVTDKHLPSEVAIVWSEDGTKSALFINRYPHAVFDFAAKRGYCRSNFPPPSHEWAESHPDHSWDDSAVNLVLPKAL